MRQREPRRHDRPFLGWIRGLPCVRCAYRGRVKLTSEAAHIKMGIAVHGWREAGVQERSHDDHATPLCRRCHREDRDAQHLMGERKFWDSMNICPACLAISLRSAYDAQASGSLVIWETVRAAKTRTEPPH